MEAIASKQTRKNVFILSNITIKISGWKIQYKLLYTISNNIDVYGEPVPRTKKVHYRAVKFEACEENRIISESLYWHKK